MSVVEEQRLVTAWRFDALLEAGYPVRLAEALAESGADLHQALEMVAAGCDPLVAGDILL